MGLINLQTNLKSLKFGNDRAHGGSSKQPYIQTPIPENSGGFGVLDTDFILRGGSRAVTDSVKDIERLGKYFTDVRNPSGLLFVAKQNLLSRTAVRTQASGLLLNEGIYTPLSTLIEAGGVAFGLHVNKQGLNPFDGPGSIGKYEEDVQKGDNRLEALYGSKIILSNEPFIVRGTTIDSSIVNILSYTGGPGSILGIGNTNIRFATGNGSSDVRTNTYDFLEGNSMGTNVFDSKQISKTSDETQNGRSKQIGFFPITQDDFRKKLKNNIPNNSSTVISNSPDYTSKNIEQRVKLGNPGGNGRNIYSYTSGAFSPGSDTYGAASVDSYDKINALPIYQSQNVALTSEKPVNDLVKFRIGVIDNNTPSLKTYIHFRAFLNQISDNYSADWNPTQYIGRGEKFYTYGGFDRKVSLSWTVAAQSKAELIPMYKKLNYLASICAPDYSGAGYMRGNIVTLTIGGYFYEQPGIITGLSYEMNDDNATWEIGINDEGESDSTVKELPHLIKVSGFNFIPIHTFVPKLQQLGFNNKGNLIDNPYGPERYIALANGNVNGTTTTNYGEIYTQ